MAALAHHRQLCGAAPWGRSQKPSAIVKFLRFSVALDATCITCTFWPPSIVMPGEAGPLIVVGGQ
jgi:hypothetical protein